MSIEWIEVTAFPPTDKGVTLYKGTSMVKARVIKFLNQDRYGGNIVITSCWESGPYVTPEYIRDKHPYLPAPPR